MVVGLGTGSTAAFAVDRLGQLLKEGKLKNIIGVPTSIRTYEQAKALGIPLATLDEQPHINVAIDGADEVRLWSCEDVAHVASMAARGQTHPGRAAFCSPGWGPGYPLWLAGAQAASIGFAGPPQALQRAIVPQGSHSYPLSPHRPQKLRLRSEGCCKDQRGAVPSYNSPSQIREE